MAGRRRSSLKQASTRRDSGDKAGGGGKDRTTAMLVLVVLSVVVTEFPQGVLAFLSGVDAYIFEHVYVPLGDVFDILVLVNSSANFILYCIMSAQFRKTFCEVFFCAATGVQRGKNGFGSGAYSATNQKTLVLTKDCARFLRIAISERRPPRAAKSAHT